jgi:hypothetical protein
MIGFNEKKNYYSLFSRRTFGREGEVQEHQRRARPDPQRVARLLSRARVITMILATPASSLTTNQSFYLSSSVLPITTSIKYNNSKLFFFSL